MLPFSAIRAVRSTSVRFYSLSSKWGGDAFVNNKNASAFESADDFERRIFGHAPDTSPKHNSFFDKFDILERARGRSSMDPKLNDGKNTQFTNDLDERYDTLEDGLDAKLKKAASSFVYDEMFEENYKYRPDATFHAGTTYEPKDLDVTKPVTQKFPRRKGFVTTTEEVLKKADFRNVRFLANFITEAGIIVKRSKTGISAKAQRKIAREIKTARAFGLMPFITMGTKPFVFGKSMTEDDLSLQFDDYYSGRLDEVEFGAKEDPIDL